MDGEGDREDVLMKLEGGEAVSKVISSALESSEKEQALSSEDLAWVDSCLVPDSEVPKGGSWDMVRDALLDVFTSHPPAPPPHPGFSSVSLEDRESDGHDGKEMKEKEDRVGDVTNEFCFKNAFLPTYKEGVWESEYVGVEEGSGFDYGFVLDENQTEPSVDEIFKVWELESLAEESDFVTQLNKALKYVESIPPTLTETPYDMLPLIVDDATMTKWKGSKGESIDELIAGIADLSLTQFNV